MVTLPRRPARLIALPPAVLIQGPPTNSGAGRLSSSGSFPAMTSLAIVKGLMAPAALKTAATNAKRQMIFIQYVFMSVTLSAHGGTRSEERRVGKECRARWVE